MALAARRRCGVTLLAAMLLPLAAAEVSPFDPPLEGWPSDPPRGSFANLRVDGFEDAPRGWISLGVPDGSNGQPRYDRGQAWPLCIVLHGSNGNGESLAGIFRGTLRQQGAIVALPTTRVDNPLLEWNYPHEMAWVLRVIEHVGRRYRIDPRRVYLLGHSMGGGGTYMQGGVMRSLWAGIGPMAGFWQFSPGPRADWLRDVPVHIVHGTADRPVPISQGDAARAAITGAGNTSVVYNRVAGGTHESILFVGSTVTQHVRELEEWMLQQRRSTLPDLARVRSEIESYDTTHGFGWSAGRTPAGWMSDAPAGNRAPTIGAGPVASPSAVVVGTAVALSATIVDPDNQEVFTEWDLGDGTTSWLATPRHRYRDPGTYTVRLTVSDFHGATNTATTSLTVSAAPGAKPAFSGAATATGAVGVAFSYAIVASSSPTFYHAAGLPPGLVLDPITGVISGTPELNGSTAVTLRAFNASGSASRTLSIVIGGTGPLQAGTLHFSAASYAALESAGAIVITVARSGGSAGPASVAFSISGGTATAGDDFVATAGTLAWAAGDAAAKTVSVTLLNDSLAGEGSETVLLTLSAATGAALGSPASAILSITDDEPGTLDITEVELRGTVSGASPVTVTVAGVPATRSGDTWRAVVLTPGRQRTSVVLRGEDSGSATSRTVVLDERSLPAATGGTLPAGNG